MAAGVIVKLGADADRGQIRAAAAGVLDTRRGQGVALSRTISAYNAAETMTAEQAQAAADELAAEPGVLWAEPNWVRQPNSTWPTPVNDPAAGRLHNLWDVREASDGMVRYSGVTSWPAGGFGTKAPAMWPSTNGSGVVVAVVDTGIRPNHPDLAGQILPGYDMISADSNGGYFRANDGDGRDADASDPGDWTEGQCGTARGSSWHGTHVAGTIAAVANNATGVAGVAPGAKILPVRVLGRCGGTDVDIAAGMMWAAGVAVPGAPVNPNPAKIINLSLGGTGACTQAY